MEKVLYIGICENGTVDIVLNIDGKDKGNFNYCSLDIVKKDYPTTEWEYIYIEDNL